MFLSNTCYPEILIEEICLEGLDGITLETLWIRLAARLNLEIPDKIKLKFWKIIQQLDDVEFFQLPKARPAIRSNDSPFSNSEDINSTFVYPFQLVPEALGSCSDYYTRVNVSKDVQSATYEEVLSRWNNNSMAIVGGPRSRWQQISSGKSSSTLEELIPLHYGILERIARSRYNGERTIGEYSLWKLCKDAKNLFYYRKKLLGFGLITKQSVSHHDDIRTNLLFHIQRFYYRRFNLKNIRMEVASTFIKSYPGHIVPFAEFKRYMIDTLLKNEYQFKYFQKSHEYQRRIVSERIAYRELYPNSTEDEWKIKTSNEERKLHTIRLIDAVDEKLETEEENEYKSEVNGLSEIGQQLIRNVYLYVLSSKNIGTTMGDIKNELGLDLLTTRLYCKILVNNTCLVFMATEDLNKQTISRYWAAEYKKAAMEQYEIAKDKLKNIFEANESSIMHDLSNTDLLNTTTDMSNKKKVFTLRKLQRINMIMEMVREKHVISRINDLINYISAKETLLCDGGGMIDKQSLLRLLTSLENDGQIKLLRTKMPFKCENKFMMFICEPHVEMNHPSVQATIEQVKTKYLIRVRQHYARSNTTPQGAKNQLLAKSYGLLPKFARIGALHEFLFYLVYMCKGEEKQITPEIQQLIDNDECSKENIPKMYSDREGRYLFVSPLPDYEGHPPGWVIVSDIILRIPLWLFTTIINIYYQVPNLTEYLNHPIKSQLLIKHLPENMKIHLFRKNKHITVVFERLISMCFMGLIKYGKQLSKTKDDTFIYVSPNAALSDTSSSCAGYDKVEDKDYPHEYFTFKTMDDVRNYWYHMRTICLNTLLGERYAAIGEQIESERILSKLAYTLKQHSIDEVNEPFQIPGDKCGAGGFDSLLFTHIKRSWSYSNIETLHQLKPVKRKSLNKNIIIKYKRKKPLIGRGEEYSKPIPFKKSKSKKHVRIIKPRILKIGKRPVDNVDKVALNVLGHKRCTWNNAEDKILCMSIAARRIMRLTKKVEICTTIRDILHKCTNSIEKATPAIRRRLLFLTRRAKTMRNIDLYLAEINTYPIYKKYQTLGRQYSKLEKLTPENLECVKIHFVELINLLSRGMHKNTDILSNIMFPENIADLHSNYNIETLLPEIKIDDSDIDFTSKITKSLLASIIHSALGTVLVKDKKKFLLIDTYKTFPEDLLALTINSLRKSGMIAYKKFDEFKTDKMKNNKNDSVMIRSQFKISISYINHLSENLPYKIYAQANQHMDVLENRRNTNNGPLNGGTNAAIFDLLAMDNISLDLTIPEDIIIADSKYSKESQESLSMDDVSNDATQNTMVLGTLQIIDSNSNHNNDLCVINSCNLTTTLLCESEDLIILSRNKICTIVNKIIMDSLFYYKDEKKSSLNIDIMKKIFSFIQEKKEVGRTPKELKSEFLINKITKIELLEILNKLVENNYIRRVGIVTYHWISVEYLQNWYTQAITCIDETKLHESIDLSLEIEDRIQETTLNSDDTNLKEAGTSGVVNRKRKLSESNAEDSEMGDGNAKKLCTEDISENYTKSTEEPKSLDDLESDNVKISDVITSQWSICNEDVSKVIDVSKDSEIEAYINYISTDNTILDEAFKILKSVYCGKSVYIFSRPWIRPDGSLNNRLLWSWMGAVLNYLLHHPTSKMINIVTRFKYLLPYQIFLIIEIFEEIGCCKKILIKSQKASLFSKGPSNLIIEAATDLDIDDDSLHVELLDAAILRFAKFKGIKHDT